MDSWKQLAPNLSKPLSVLIKTIVVPIKCPTQMKTEVMYGHLQEMGLNNWWLKCLCNFPSLLHLHYLRAFISFNLCSLLLLLSCYFALCPNLLFPQWTTTANSTWIHVPFLAPHKGNLLRPLQVSVLSDSFYTYTAFPQLAKVTCFSTTRWQLICFTMKILHFQNPSYVPAKTTSSESCKVKSYWETAHKQFKYANLVTRRLEKL